MASGMIGFSRESASVITSDAVFTPLKHLTRIYALLQLVKQHLENREEINEDVFAEYESLAIKPKYTFKRKDEHKKAVLALSKALAGEKRDRADEDVGKTITAR